MEALKMDGHLLQEMPEPWRDQWKRGGRPTSRVCPTLSVVCPCLSYLSPPCQGAKGEPLFSKGTEEVRPLATLAFLLLDSIRQRMPCEPSRARTSLYIVSLFDLALSGSLWVCRRVATTAGSWPPFSQESSTFACDT